MAFTKDQILSLEATFDQGFTRTFLEQNGFTTDELTYAFVQGMFILSEYYYLSPETLDASKLLFALIRTMQLDIRLEEDDAAPSAAARELRRLLDLYTRLHLWLQADAMRPEQT